MLLAHLIGLVCLIPSLVSGISPYCDPTIANIWCDHILPRVDGVPDYNLPGQNLSKPWVIGHETVVKLQPGDYTIGNVNKFGILIPAIFIIENGSLIIENNGEDEVSFGADIYLCDNSSFIIKESNFRSNAFYQYQYTIWASGTSRTFFQGVNYTTIAKGVPENVPSTLGAHWIRDRATLTVEVGSKGFGITSQRGALDAWELLSLDEGQININGMDGFAEFYVATDASFIVANSSHNDFFFEACGTYDLILDDLPQLCSLDPSDHTMPPCLSDQVPRINYHTSPPDTSFVVDFYNTQMFSWAVSLFSGSNVVVRDTGKYANLFFGLNIAKLCLNEGCTQFKSDYNISVTPQGVYGLEELFNLTIINTTVGGYHVWFSDDGLTLNIASGSELGDISSSPGSTVTATSTTFRFGAIHTSSNSELYLYKCLVAQSTLVKEDSLLYAVDTFFTDLVIVVGTIDMADCGVANIDVRDGSKTYDVAIMTPTDGTSFYSNETLDITGRVQAFTVNYAPLNPFPTAILKITNSQNQETVLAEITTTILGTSMGNFNLSNYESGTYTLTLTFGGDHPIARKSINIISTQPATTTESTTTTGAETTGVTTGEQVTSTTANDSTGTTDLTSSTGGVSSDTSTSSSTTDSTTGEQATSTTASTITTGATSVTSTTTGGTTGTSETVTGESILLSSTYLFIYSIVFCVFL